MKRMQGLTMIELLIGLAIGSLVIIGTVFVYNQSRTTYSINETQARLQENARYVFAVLEPDIQLAGNYGFSNNAADLMWGSTKTSAADMEPADAARGPAAVHTCGNNFALNLYMPVDGFNNNYGLGCVVAAAAGAPVATADVLTIRRASSEATTVNVGRLQVYANRLLKSQQQLFNSGTAPGPIDVNREIRDLMFRSYYLATDSRARAGFPALWRKNLGSDAAGTSPEVGDEEIMPGVEDFQVQFGIDTGDRDANNVVDAALDKNAPFGVPDYLNGIVSRWVNPGHLLTQPASAGAGAINAQVVAVRVWIRIRADQPEVGFTDTRAYQYADMAAAWTPPAGNLASTRRILVSRTFFVRNTRIY